MVLPQQNTPSPLATRLKRWPSGPYVLSNRYVSIHRSSGSPFAHEQVRRVSCVDVNRSSGRPSLSSDRRLYGSVNVSLPSLSLSSSVYCTVSDRSMAKVLRDSAFGATVRLLTSSKFLTHREDEPGFVFPPPRGSGEQAKADDTLVTWYSADDCYYPQAWSLFRKSYCTLLLGLYTTSVYIAAGIAPPGIDLLMSEFDANFYVAALGNLTLIIMGYGISPMVLTPSTMKPEIGKLYPYLISFFLFIAFTVGSAAAPNATAYLILRFLAGLAGSPGVSTVSASFIDIWRPGIAPRANGVWACFAGSGPFLGPLIGGAAINQWSTWRAPLYLNACAASVVFVLMFFTLPDISHATILEQRRKRIQQVTGRTDLTTDWRRKGLDVSIQSTVVGACKIALDFAVLYTNSLLAIAYLILYSWFETIPVVFGENGYGFTIVQRGLVYLPMICAVIVGTVAYILLLKYGIEPKARRRGPRGDDFLLIGKLSVFLMPISLFWFAWTANRTPWYVPMIATVPFGLGIFACFMFSFSSLAITYQPHVLSIFALSAFSRSVFASVGPLYAHPAIDAIGVAWFTTILAIALTFMIPLPFLLERYGPQIRRRSKYAVPDPEDKKAAVTA